MGIAQYAGKIGLIVFVFIAVGFGVWQSAILLPDPVKQVEFKSQGASFFQSGDRIIEYFQFGDAKGTPLLVLPGEMHTGKFFQYYDQWASKKNIRLITLSLPGYGLTDPDEQRQLVNYEDAKLLMDKLNIEKFYVAGVHLGAIHAAAVANALPKRVIGTGLFSPSVHFSDAKSVKGLGWAEELYLNWSPVAYFPDVFAYVSSYALFSDIPSVTSFFEHAQPSELEILNRNGPLKTALFTDTIRSMNRTHRGFSEHARLLSSPYGFNFKDTSSGNRKVVVSAGQKDVYSPLQQKLAGEIPNSRLVTYEDEGRYHPYTRFEDLIEKLVEKPVSSSSTTTSSAPVSSSSAEATKQASAAPSAAESTAASPSAAASTKTEL